MQQTFYIEPDEEIISVIGRLRKSGSERNFFVFPKRALVLQSIINLRLFQREAQKLGKKIVIVTQDETGKALAEKAGLETERYSDEFSQRGQHIELRSQPQAPAPVGEPMTAVEHAAPHADMIGSSDFHALPRQVPVPLAQPVPLQQAAPTEQKLRVRNASPERHPSLNSVRYAEEVSRSQAPIETGTAPAVPSAFPAPQAAPVAVLRGERLKNFYSDRTPAPQPAVSWKASLPKTPSPAHIPAIGKKAKIIFAVFGVVVATSLVGIGIFLFLPKAIVHVIPHKTVQNADLQLDAVAQNGMPSSDETVAARIAEKDESVSLSAAVTGTSGSSVQKAHGTVVISNSFSQDTQPLIATTRFETADGKVFRLAESVVVPGMTVIGGQSTPGAIEASVVADQAGDGYNVDPTTFTIPGFKGSPKYDKFSAKSSKPFVGGSSAGSGMAVISQADIDKAENDAKEQAKSAFMDEMKPTLSSGEKILEESIEVVPQAAASPQAGTAATSFDYKNTFRVRAFIFSEDEIRAKFEKNATTDIQGVAFHPVSVTIAYGESLPDYDRSSARIRAHALITLESDVDQGKLKTALAGQDENGIEKVLAAFPGIKKISVDFSPSWFVSSIPKSEGRIAISVDPGEE